MRCKRCQQRMSSRSESDQCDSCRDSRRAIVPPPLDEIDVVEDVDVDDSGFVG